MKKRLIGALGAAAISMTALMAPAMADGNLRVAIPSNLNTLDAAKTKLGEEYIMNFLIFSGLTEVDGKGSVKPDLAESWTKSDDQKTWTFKLRPGVKFHDGSPLEAEDVKATIERIKDKATGSTARVNFDLVESIETPDKETIVFKLKIPYSGFAELFGDRQVRIMKRDEFDTVATHPIGTGPFMFKSFTPGDRVELVKNPDYYIKGEPKLDAVTFRIMPESAAQIAALETGDIDLVWSLPLESIDQMKKNPDVTVDATPTSTWDGLIMNAAKKPFDDARVRKAVLMALDKPALVEVALYGQGTPTHTMIPPSHPYYNKDIPISPPDVEGAKKLLAEAGFPDGFETTLYVPVGRPTRERLGIAAKEFLAPVGIKVDIQRVPWDKFVKEIEGKAAFYTDGFFSRPTIDTSIYPFFHSTGSWNTQLWNYNNPAIDKVLDDARAAKTEEERAALYKQFQALAEETPAGAIPYVLNHVNAYRKNVKGFASSPMMWLDLRETTVQ
ncbi:ABC transporter substrate-binding protein [Ancylobacter pratisalsi]|uniref:ABC transporter substrate-binding protein n=1 Tax=Ancylobacter pratisalsi TaxID=1745854 RepID=A0A6P1YNG3_9HYPH|nr:ABC transporter substrate-binding protein [Ancylobacter pratisalsi]QIB34251.1 ABC transporter substrate-binding protein [Ancylobacter pratisalsi]